MQIVYIFLLNTHSTCCALCVFCLGYKNCASALPQARLRTLLHARFPSIVCFPCLLHSLLSLLCAIRSRSPLPGFAPLSLLPHIFFSSSSARMCVALRFFFHAVCVTDDVWGD